MLRFSFSTVYMAVIASNLLLILIAIFFRSKRIMVNMGYKLLAIFTGLTALRFLLPFELPFTKSVYLEEYETISRVISYIRHTHWMVWNVPISIWTIMMIVWFVGFGIYVVHYLGLCKKAKYFILSNGLDVTEDEPYHSLLTQICRERKKKNCFRVMTISGIGTPMLYGVFKPTILIPENLELTKEELYYTLVHEISHHFHHDLFIKQLMKFATMLYWWNPACYILNDQIRMVLEMHIDKMITASGRETIADYLHCLCEIGEQASESIAPVPSIAMTIISEEEGELIQRYRMLASSDQKKNLALNVALSAIVLGTYVMSYLFIWEAYYVSPAVAAESVGQTEENTYAVQNADGTYDVYYKDYLVDTTASLEYYMEDIIIYTEAEYAAMNR